MEEICLYAKHNEKWIKPGIYQECGTVTVKDNFRILPFVKLRLINELSCVANKFLNELWMLKFIKLI